MEEIQVIIQEPEEIVVDIQQVEIIKQGGECEIPDLVTLYELAKI